MQTARMHKQLDVASACIRASSSLLQYADQQRKRNVTTHRLMHGLKAIVVPWYLLTAEMIASEQLLLNSENTSSATAMRMLQCKTLCRASRNAIAALLDIVQSAELVEGKGWWKSASGHDAARNQTYRFVNRTCQRWRPLSCDSKNSAANLYMYKMLVSCEKRLNITRCSGTVGKLQVFNKT